MPPLKKLDFMGPTLLRAVEWPQEERERKTIGLVSQQLL